MLMENQVLLLGYLQATYSNCRSFFTTLSDLSKSSWLFVDEHLKLSETSCFREYGDNIYLVLIGTIMVYIVYKLFCYFSKMIVSVFMIFVDYFAFCMWFLKQALFWLVMLFIYKKYIEPKEIDIEEIETKSEETLFLVYDNVANFVYSLWAAHDK